VFLHQSAALWSAYHQLQIMVHRPFVPQHGRAGPAALSSLAACTSAASACARLIDAHQRRKRGLVPVQIVRAAARTRAGDAELTA
jgi:hypothetical protein